MQQPLEFGPDPAIMGGKNGFGVEEEVKFRSLAGTARDAPQVFQSMPDRQQQLDAAGPGSDHADTGSSGSRQNSLPDLGPAAEKVADGLDWNYRFSGSRNRTESGCGADVDGDQVVGYGWPGTAQDPLGVQVEADSLIVVEAGARELGKWPQVDVGLIIFVVAGDEAREHS